MKQLWQKAVLKVDGLTLRERVIVFAMAALVLITLINSLLLDPQFVRQKQLSQRVKQEQGQIAAIQAEIENKARAQVVDPDEGNRQRLQALQQQATHMRDAVRNVQKGLVSPDRMPELLDNILKQHGNLRLVSLRKLPVTNLAAGAPLQAAAETAAPGGTPEEGVFRHGVEITVEGSYLDMMSYMVELEKMPWQVFWGKTKLNVENHPKATLTLTLFTLSLDKSWLNI